MTTDLAAVVRAWVVALSVVALVGFWAAVARNPFPTAPKPAAAIVATNAATRDPRVAALDRRAQQLRARAVRVKRQRDLRWATWRRDLAVQRERIRVAQAQAAVASPSYSVSSTPSYSAPSYSAPAPAPAPAATTSSS
jgi:hypothetical protein